MIRLKLVINRVVRVLSRQTAVIYSRNELTLKPNHYGCYWHYIIIRSFHVRSASYCSKREWLVTHMAEQELALSALRRLELDVNKFKRAKKSDIESVMKGSMKDIFVKGEDTVFLIRCCGALLPNEELRTRKELTQVVWKKLCDSGMQLQNIHFVALLRTNFENQQPVCPKEFLSEMERLGVNPDNDTLMALLWCVRVGGDYNENMNNLAIVIEQLKSRGLASNREMFGALTSVLAEAGNLSEAEDVVEAMKKSKMKLTSKVYSSLIKGYIKLQMKQPVLKLLGQVKDAGLQFSPSGYASIVSKLAEISSIHGNDSELELIHKIMPHINVPTSEDTCNYVSNAVLELIHNGKEDAAVLLVSSLPPSLQCGSQFLDPLPILFSKEIVRANIPPEKVLGMCDQLEDMAVKLLKKEASLKPFLVHTVTGYALECGKRDLSLFLLEALRSREVVLRPHYFWPLILASGKEEKKQEGAMEMLEKMIKLKVEPDFETLTSYVLPFMRLDNSALAALTQLKDCGVTGVHLLTSVTHWLLENGQLVQAANLNDVHQGHMNPLLVLEPLAKCVTSKMDKMDNSMLKCLPRLLKGMDRKGMKGIDYAGHFLLELTDKLGLFTKNGRVPEFSVRAIDYLLAVLKVLDSSNIKISNRAADILLDALHPQLELKEAGMTQSLNMPGVHGDLNLPPSDKFHPVIPHPRNMDVEELENHLLELRAKGLNERGVLRRLFQFHCRSKNTKRVLQIKEDMDKGGHSFSPGMLSSLLDLYTNEKLIDKSRELYLKIKRDHPKFKMDDYKAVDLAELMCQSGHVEDAITLLREHSNSVRVKGGTTIERNVLNLLKAMNDTNMICKSSSNVHVNEVRSGVDVSENGTSVWTTDKFLKELIKLGYVSDPPHKSFISKLKSIVRRGFC